MDNFYSGLISDTCDEIKDFLLEKNRDYKNSAFEPLRLFSHSTTEEQIRVRIDDKLSRIANKVKDNEDTVLDLIGYLILLRVHQKVKVDRELLEILEETDKKEKLEDILSLGK